MRRGDRLVAPAAGQKHAPVIPAQAGIQGRPTSVRPEIVEGLFYWPTKNGAYKSSDNRTTLGRKLRWMSPFNAPDKMRLGVLASHGGSNLQAIIDSTKSGALDAQVAVVISNNSDSLALDRARKEAIPTFHLSRNTHPEPEQLDQAILQALKDQEVNLVALAGYMRPLGPAVLDAYRRRILNIHPALLPNHGGHGMYGMRVHESVIKSGDRMTGVTIHLVDGAYDQGPIVAQTQVPVLKDDTAETLARRVLQTEHRFYSEVLQRVRSGDIDLDNLRGVYSG